MLSHVHWSFLKKGCLLISSTPLRPRRTSLRGGEVFAFEQLNRLHDSGTPVIHARLFQCSGCLNKQNIYWFPTCQSRKHRWDFWHHWKCHCHPGRSGHSCGSWFYCKSPPMSLRRKAYRLCTRQSKIKSNNFSYMTLTYFVVNSGFIIKQLKKKKTHQQASHKETLLLTTSHTLCHSCHCLLGISVPQVKCSLEFQLLCHIVPSHPDREKISKPFNYITEIKT